MTKNASAPLVITATTIEIDPLTEVPVTTVTASKLREGMVLVDEFDMPAAVIDHRMRATRNSGAVKFMLLDVETGGHIEHAFHANGTVRVAAA